MLSFAESLPVAQTKFLKLLSKLEQLGAVFYEIQEAARKNLIATR